jgi:Helix-turn-helix domain
MSSTDTLTLKEAADLAGLSEVTMRRLVKAGKVETEPRSSDKEPWRISRKALDKALEAGGLVRQTKPSTSQVSAKEAEGLRVELVAVKAALEAIKAEREAMLERANRAEGALEESQRAFQAALAALEPAIKALTDRAAEQMTSQPVFRMPLDYSEGNRRKRWFRG